MSHNIETAIYPEDVNRDKVQREWDTHAAIEGRQEGCTGLHGKIRWLNVPPLEDEEAAEAYIESVDRGWYDQIAVRFKQYERLTPSKRHQALAAKVRELLDKYNHLERTLHYKDAKAQFIGCRHCGSKIAKAYLDTNMCPVCGKDLRPESVLDAISNARARWDKACADLKAEEKKMMAKQTSKAKICWLVKIEYHT